MRYQHNITHRNLDRHRRDALAMERLTSAKHVVNMYAFCGNSAINDYSDGGDINGMIWGPKRRKYGKIEMLKVGLEAAVGVMEMHQIDGAEYPTIAHTDITPGQFILVDGIYKLNDFNRCRFMRWNTTSNSACGYKVGNNPGVFRSPEEYRYEVQDEKVDNYSLGNVLYVLLVKEWPFDHVKEQDDIKKFIKEGKRSEIPKLLEESNHPADVAMIKAIRRCWTDSREERALAAEIVDILKEALEELVQLNQ
eukprot:CAMPEP_0113321470 /NCGR_PEP_ID=MMETSP0010_2-20120614/14944_1 /TAXON_ID=216773 ORGANISM="Corethron hystrix, Strain 308" /NCGR_SAMPLE_ID=MMETSP0010_2 /ASSEMBLY_ACC=CAM_ASM_000155 /LENGTH=250 /DNA_ID=CAMNT_0000179615 /DNA_START=13 /DNA_END=765 /DNA_ORIENTATION=- /assembly_acc=CAM_ASM_000155